MISSYKMDDVANKYKKYVNNIEYEDIKKDEFNISKFHILNAMIAMKNGLLPFLDNKGYKSNSVHSYYDMSETERKNTLECKHYTLYRYDFDGLDVMIHNRGDCLTVYVLYDKFSDKEFGLYDISETKHEEMCRWSDFYNRFGDMDSERKYGNMPTWFELFEKNEKNTNLTWDEFKTEANKLQGYNFIVFDILFHSDRVGRYYNDHIELKKFICNGEFKALYENDSVLAIEEFSKKYDTIIKKIDRFADDSIKRGEAFKIYLDNCLNSIIKKKEYPRYDNSASTGNYDYDWENMFETRTQINLTRCELGEFWNMALFDMNVDFLYTK